MSVGERGYERVRMIRERVMTPLRKRVRGGECESEYGGGGR